MKAVFFYESSILPTNNNNNPRFNETAQFDVRVRKVGDHDEWKVQWYAPIKIIGIKIIVPIKSEKSLRLMVHISKTLTKSLR